MMTYISSEPSVVRRRPGVMSWLGWVLFGLSVIERAVNG